jgi:hypothetical protein
MARSTAIGRVDVMSVPNSSSASSGTSVPGPTETLTRLVGGTVTRFVTVDPKDVEVEEISRRALRKRVLNRRRAPHRHGANRPRVVFRRPRHRDARRAWRRAGGATSDQISA